MGGGVGVSILLFLCLVLLFYFSNAQEWLRNQLIFQCLKAYEGFLFPSQQSLIHSRRAYVNIVPRLIFKYRKWFIRTYVSIWSIL